MGGVTDMEVVTLSHTVLHNVTLTGHCPPPLPVVVILQLGIFKWIIQDPNYNKKSSLHYPPVVVGGSFGEDVEV